MSAEKRKPGRPPGKRSNPNYVAVTGYIRKQIYRQMKVRCAEEDLEISEVLDRLISQWLQDSG